MTEAPNPPQPGNRDAKAEAKAAKAYAKAQRPWFKKKRFIIPLGFVALMIIVAATSSGGGPEKVDGSSASSNGGGSTDKTTGPGSKADPIAVGETVKLAGTEYTVTAAKTASTVGGPYVNEAAGGVYVIVDIEIVNRKDETKTFLDSSAKFVAANGKTYSTDTDGTIANSVDGDSLIFTDMQPDVPESGTLVYDVPQGVLSGGLLEVSDLFGTGSAYIDLGL